MDWSWLERVRVNDTCCTKLRLMNKGITASMASELADAMKTNSTVSSIELTENEIGDEGCSNIASVIPLVSQSLRSLEVGKNNITGEGVAALANALIESKSLEELDLSQNGEIGPDGIQSLASALPQISCLVKLELAETNLGDAGVAALVQGLQMNQSIKWLGLRSNNIGPEGAMALSNGFLLQQPRTTGITSLNLRQNRLGIEGVRQLTNALKTCHTITDLDISSNQLGTIGAQVITEVLVLPNASLKILFLSHNQIGDEGMEAIAMALKENTSVTYLDLQNNEISFVGADALEETFRVNRTLTHIILQGNDPGVVAPPEPLQRNRVIRNHGQSLLERGTGLFVRVVKYNKANHHNSQPQQELAYRLEWTEEFWKGTKLDEAIEWVLIHRVLQVLKQATGNSCSAASSLPPWPLPSGQLLECCRQPNALVDLVDKSTNEEGSNLLHVAIAAESPLALDLCKFLVSELGANIDRIRDAQGRSAREIGVVHSCSERIQEWARCVGFFLHRYQVEGGSLQAATPVYRTEKGMAHFARDAWKSRTDPQAEVMLFVLADPSQFSSEVSCRLKNDSGVIPTGVDIPEKAQRFKPEYVVPLIRYHDELAESGVRHKCLVFPLLERSLQGMIDLERVACCDFKQIRGIVIGIGNAVQHVHDADPEKPLIHCNVEPRNIIRANGNYKLMGFDLAVPEGELITAKRAVTNACPPEMVRCLIELENWEELNNSLSELKRQQLQITDATVGESNRLLEIIKEVQRLRKKITIRELLEGSNTRITCQHGYIISRTQKGELSSATTKSQEPQGIGLSQFIADNNNKIDPSHPLHKQLPGEQSCQDSYLFSVNGEETATFTVDEDPSIAASQLLVPVGGKLEQGMQLNSETGGDINTPAYGCERRLHLIAQRTFDVWSFGTTLFKMFTGEDLFPTNNDGHLASVDDHIELALWKGLSAEQLDKVLSRCPDATTIDKDRAKDLLIRCLHPDPSKRPQNMEEVISQCFLEGNDNTEDQGDLTTTPLNFSYDTEETPQTAMPLSFLLLPCQLFISEQTGKLVAPAQAKDAIDKFCRMQELAVLQHLLTAKYKEDDEATEELIRECRNLEGKEAATRLLKYMDISETSVEYFIDRIQDLNEFKNTPSTFMENKTKEAFHDWWQAQSGRKVYFYLIDEFFLKPIATAKYPIELEPRSSFLRDLIPLFCMRKTQIPVLSACSFVLGRSMSLPSRLNDWAVGELANLNTGLAIADYQAHRQAVNKLGNFDIIIHGKQRVPFERFESIDDAMSIVLEVFFSEYDPEGEFAGLRKVSDRDGSIRWTSDLGCMEMERAKATSVTESISRRRQLEEALHEAQDTLQRVGATAKRLVEERDALQREKLTLLRSNKGLEDYIQKEMITDVSTGCCAIL